jgi:anaerobic selenocysteine-containing dehydrogenase
MPVGLKGNPHHPLNRGGLCPVGQAGLEVLYAPERIHGPQRRTQQGAFEEVSWDSVLGEIASRLRELRSNNSGNRIAFLVDTQGPLLRELIEHLAHGLGSLNVADSHVDSPLPYRLTQGIDDPPAYDLARADVVLSFGLDLYEDGPSPVHAISAMIGTRSLQERATLLHAGTRLSPTAAKASEHLVILPSSHAALALGIAHVLVREGKYDRRFVEEHTFGFDDWRDEEGQLRLGFRRLLLERYYPDRAAQLCGCEPARVIRMARRFAAASRPVAVAGGEALSGSSATWTAMAVHALNALVGAFDRAGGVAWPTPIPFTPLAPLAEARAVAADVFSVTEPRSAALGVDPVEAIADGVLDETHPIDVLFVVNANPLYESPAARRLQQAFERIPMVVAIAPFRNETAARADFILPSHVFLESWQESSAPATVPTSTLGLAHPVIEPLFDTRHPGDVMLELARRVGGPMAEGMPWSDYVEYLKYRVEGLQVSGQGAVLSGSFAASWVRFLEERGWRFLEHTDFKEFWQDCVREAGWWNPVLARADWSRLFQTPSGRFEFFSQELEKHLVEVGGALEGSTTKNARMQRGMSALGLEADVDEVCMPHYEPPADSGEGDVTLLPFRPVTARGRFAAVSPMLLEMFGYHILSGWESWAEIAPTTAHELGVEDGDRIALESDQGGMEAVVHVHPGAAPGVVHAPLGLGHQEMNSVARGIGANPIKVLVAARDPLSGNLSAAPTRVRVRLVRRREHGGPAPLEGGHA